MKPELTIIMPCYNCTNTLREAVDSCYAQGLSSFEIVMVDDGSTDGTRTVIDNLAREHNNIKAFSHEKNRGGGAARNTAVSHASSDIIFCLDSDDILPQNTLDRMLALLREKRCDGILFSGSYSFSKIKEKNRHIDFGLDTDKPLALEVLFSGKPWVLGACFMYTKKAFETAGRYPTDHGFDTQGFGFSFAASGLKAYIGPETFLYQRQMGSKESYFERVYGSGEYSIGYYLTFRSHMYVFSEKIKDIILNYDIFNKNTLETNMLVDLQKEYAKDKTSFFAPADRAHDKDPESLYQEGRSREALDLLLSSVRRYKNIHFDTIRYMHGILNGSPMTVDDFKSLIRENTVSSHGHNALRPTLFTRVIRKIKRLTNKK